MLNAVLMKTKVYPVFTG